MSLLLSNIAQVFARYDDLSVRHIKSAADGGGLLPLLTSGATILASNEVVAAVLEHGSESLIREAASLGTTETEAVRFGSNMAGAINKLLFLGATKLAIKAVKGGKGTVKPLSPKESASISKQSFREMQTNPLKLQASISKGITEAVEMNPLLKMEVERLTDAINQRPYNPRAMESLLQARYGRDAVSSTTMPRVNAPYVRMAGKSVDVTFIRQICSIYD
jgi:hypothetical protein